jgi:hypothetical protein
MGRWVDGVEPASGIRISKGNDVNQFASFCWHALLSCVKYPGRGRVWRFHLQATGADGEHDIGVSAHHLRRQCVKAGGVLGYIEGKNLTIQRYGKEQTGVGQIWSGNMEVSGISTYETD